MTALLTFLLLMPNLTCNTPIVQKAIASLRVQAVTSLLEHGIVIDWDGHDYKMRLSDGDDHSIPLTLTSQSVLMLHSHPSPYDANPSGADIKNSKQRKIPGIIVSRSGYWIVYSDGSNAPLSDPRRCTLR